MSIGWNHSAGPWIAAMGERGDWGREHVLDPVMLERVSARRFGSALDVGCGEGRFCRLLKAVHIPVVGIDPTEKLLASLASRKLIGRTSAPRDGATAWIAANWPMPDVAGSERPPRATVPVLPA